MPYFESNACAKNDKGTDYQSLGKRYQPISDLCRKASQSRQMASETRKGTNGELGVMSRRAGKRRNGHRRQHSPPPPRLHQQHESYTSSKMKREKITRSIGSMIGIALGAIALGMQLFTVGYVWAKVLGRIDQHDKDITRIEMTVNKVGDLKTEMEVMKTRLINIDDTLKRLERELKKR